MNQSRHVVLVGLLALPIGLILPSAPALAQSWDVAADFSPSQNPNGVWTLGYLLSFGGTLTPYDTNGDWQPGFPQWTGTTNPSSDGFSGIFVKNTTSSLFIGGTNVIEAGKIFWQPGPNNEMPVARWTSPVNGYVLISAKFTGQDNTGNCTVDPHVLKNGVSIYDGYVSGFYGCSANNYTDRSGTAPEQTFSTVVQVAENDTIAFVVGYGGNDYYYDGSGIEASIAHTTPPINAGSIREVKEQQDSTSVSLSGSAVVTGKFNGFFYVEDPLRTSGIKVMSSASVAVGDAVSLIGTVATVDGERCICGATITSRASADEITPLGMPGKALALGKGPDVTGLLVRIFGTVSYRAPNGSYIYVDNGSELRDGTGQQGVRVLLTGPADPISTEIVPGQFVAVTGVAAMAAVDSMVVRAVRPRGDADLQPAISNGDAMAMANWWIDSLLGPDSSSRPFSFTYAEQPSALLLAGWLQSYSVREIDANRTERTITYTDPAGQLQVRCVATVYSDYPAVDWTLFFDNIGKSNSSIIENIQSLNANLAVGSGASDATLYYADGSAHVVTDFQPRETVLGDGASATFKPHAGRSSENTLPFFNLAKFDTSGVVIAVGWSGQWAATFARIGDTVNVQSGMERTHLRLYPGESMRTPSTLLLFWSGPDRIHGQNQLRRLILDHYTPRPGGELVTPPIAAAPSASVPYAATTQANMIQGIDNCAAHALPIDTWWIDAGWYPCNGNWVNVGTWTPDPARYPNGMKPVADEAHAKGYKFLLWFEPERVAAGTWLAVNHPAWIYGGSGGGLLNLGNPEALNWVKTNIGGMIGSIGVDIYRNDFNIQPLSYWRNADASDRQGANEIKYITGLYSFWDYLLTTYPNLLIDNCASGGTRLDIELIKRSLALWRSDYGVIEPYSAGQCMTHGLSYWLPITGVGENSLDPYKWWSYAGSHNVVLFDFYNDPTIWLPCTQMINKLKSVRDMYTGDFYPLTPYTTDESAWEAWQFDRPDLGKGLLEVFRRPLSPTAGMSYKLRGLIPSASYMLTNLSTGWNCTKTGRELMQTGFSVFIGANGAALFTYRLVD